MGLSLTKCCEKRPKKKKKAVEEEEEEEEEKDDKIEEEDEEVVKKPIVKSKKNKKKDEGESEENAKLKNKAVECSPDADKERKGMKKLIKNNTISILSPKLNNNNLIYEDSMPKGKSVDSVKLEPSLKMSSIQVEKKGYEKDQTKEKVFVNIDETPVLNNLFHVQIWIESVDISYKLCDDFGFSFMPYVEVKMPNNPIEEYHLFSLDEEKLNTSDIYEPGSPVRGSAIMNYNERSSILGGDMMGLSNSSTFNNSNLSKLSLSPIRSRSSLRIDATNKDKIFSIKSVNIFYFNYLLRRRTFFLANQKLALQLFSRLKMKG